MVAIVSPSIERPVEMERDLTLPKFSQRDLRNMQTYTSTTKRGAVYIWVNAQKPWADVGEEIQTLGKIGLITGGVVGAGVGGLKGGVAGIPAGPLGVLSAGLVGAAVGGGAAAAAVVGAATIRSAVAVSVSAIRIASEDLDYVEWRAGKMREILPPMQQFIDHFDLEVEELCPITRLFAVIPLRTPYGRLYDGEAITSWLYQRTPSRESFAAKSPSQKLETIQSFDPYRHIYIASDEPWRLGLGVADLRALPDVPIQVSILRGDGRSGIVSYSRDDLCRHLAETGSVLTGLSQQDLLYAYQYHVEIAEKIKKAFNRILDTQIDKCKKQIAVKEEEIKTSEGRLEKFQPAFDHVMSYFASAHTIRERILHGRVTELNDDLAQRRITTGEHFRRLTDLHQGEDRFKQLKTELEAARATLKELRATRF